MRLAEFILANVEPILAEWETFARDSWPDDAGAAGPGELRDDAEDILRAAAADMASDQTAQQRSDKSRGEGEAGADSDRVDLASGRHGADRVRSGFGLMEVVAEYRALRASVTRLWRASRPALDPRDLDDLTRFNESIDQALTEATRAYTRAVDRSRRMFLAVLGHDLRNPLAAMRVLAKVLMASGRLDDESLEMVATMAAGGDAMTAMIGDLLDFAGVGLGAAMPVSPAPTDLGRICRQVVDETRAAHPAHTLHFAAHGDLAGAWDASRVRQLLSNLLANAVQHGTGPVELTARDDGPEVVLAVHNQGPPIPRTALPTIFEPLVRGSVSPDGPAYHRPGSLGLGLYIAREVAAAHGGRIRVESSAEAGTVFTVRLPRRRAAR